MNQPNFIVDQYEDLVNPEHIVRIYGESTPGDGDWNYRVIALLDTATYNKYTLFSISEKHTAENHGFDSKTAHEYCHMLFNDIMDNLRVILNYNKFEKEFERKWEYKLKWEKEHGITNE